MFKHGIFLGLLITVLSCGKMTKHSLDKTGSIANPPDISLEEFKQLDWIVGNWKTQVEGPGFYQDFRFLNDSILEIRSYQMNGKDTSNTNLASVYWRNKHLYMGVNGEWVAVMMRDSAMRFDPLRKGWLAIDWKMNNKDQWTLTHSREGFNRPIKMVRQAPLEELMRK